MDALQRLRLLKELRKQRAGAEALGTGPSAALQKLRIAKAIREIRRQLGLGERYAIDPRAFSDFFHGKPGAPDRFVVTKLSESERSLFGVQHGELWLSRTSLDEHKARHPEVGIDDYMMIPDIVHNGAVWGGHQERRYLLLRIGNKPYRAAIKTSQDHADAWFLSLVISGKQKPPKGAVLLRKAADGPGWRP